MKASLNGIVREKWSDRDGECVDDFLILLSPLLFAV